jgi:hypothetical protein
MVEPSEHTIDISSYSALSFWVKTGRNLKVEVQLNSESGAKRTVHVSGYGWDGTDSWQEISVPVSAFGTSGLNKVFCPFMITIEAGSETFLVDKIRWIPE